MGFFSDCGGINWPIVRGGQESLAAPAQDGSMKEVGWKTVGRNSEVVSGKGFVSIGSGGYGVSLGSRRVARFRRKKHHRMDGQGAE